MIDNKIKYRKEVLMPELERRKQKLKIKRHIPPSHNDTR